MANDTRLKRAKQILKNENKTLHDMVEAIESDI